MFGRCGDSMHGWTANMTKIAIDIALLLPDDIEDRCIQINQECERKRPLGKEDYIPHVTLAMGIIDEKDLSHIQEYLQNLQSNPLELSVDGIRYSETPEGNKSALEVTNTQELQTLHETILNHVKQYLQKGASVEMLFKGDETGMTEKTKLALDTYSEKTSFENYWPHITLGCYDAKTKLPITFKADTIALCHVGDGVTCRKIISTYKLN